MTPWQISINNLNNVPVPKPPVGRPVIYSSRDDEKECSKCHDVKPMDQFRYVPANGRRVAACISCEALAAKIKRQEKKQEA